MRRVTWEKEEGIERGETQKGRWDREEEREDENERWEREKKEDMWEREQKRGRESSGR